MTEAQPAISQRPSHEQWEDVRFIISKLWLEEQKTQAFIINSLRVCHGLYATPKTLKTKLQEWGLLKKMNLKDAEDLLAARARLDALGHEGLLLLRGRYFDDIQSIHDYQRRRERAYGSGPPKSKSKTSFAPPDVVTISWPLDQRPKPAITLLSKLESLLREMQFLLHGAKEASMCVPGTTTLDWKTSTTESERLERSLYGSIWESTRALEEGDFAWAGLCWQSAQLTLEDLIWEPDLNLWISFVRCCVRLHRFQAAEVAQHLLSKLHWLRDELPSSAPHRALVYALTDLPLPDLVDGCVFVLEVNLRNVELLWPLESGCHAEYQLHVNEERLRQGLGMPKDMPHSRDHKALIDQAPWKDSPVQWNWLYTCLLQSEYDKAETIARNAISQLEREQDPYVDNVPGKRSSALLAYWYSLLGTTQYYQDDYTESRVSYLKCLQYHRKSEETRTDDVLQPVHLHRVLVVLRWLNTTPIQGQEQMASELSSLEHMLKEEFDQQLQTREDTPFRRQSNRTNTPPNRIVTSKKTKNPQRYNNIRSMPTRPRVVQRHVFVSVNPDNAQVAGVSVSAKNDDKKPKPKGRRYSKPPPPDAN